MVSSITNNYIDTFYKNSYQLMKQGFSFTELQNLSPLDINIFKLLKDRDK